MFNIIVLFYSARNQRLLAYLLPKAAKGSKNAFAPRFAVRPTIGLPTE
jgi:hypothetical protein